MIADGKAGRFDTIITKDVSRFARNLEDTLRYVRELREARVGVYFISNNIDTLDRSSSLLLNFLGSIAENESERISERVKWGQRRSMERGVVFGNKCLGYVIEGGKLEIDPTTAPIIKQIFHVYLHEGKGLGAIGKELEAQGILSSVGGKRWDATAVKRILINEKYAGDLKQMKSYTEDFLTQKSRRNKGEVEFVIIEGNHEAIIDRDTWKKTQEELIRRSSKQQTSNATTKRYSNRYTFSSKLACGCCGASFISRNRKANDGIRLIQRWQCGQYFKYGSKAKDERGCEASMVRNEILEQVFRLALSDVAQNKDTIIKEMTELIIGTLDADSTQDEQADTLKEIADIEKRMERAVSLCIKGLISEDELAKQKVPLDKQKTALQQRLARLNDNISLTNEREALVDKIKSRITQIVHAEVFSEDVVKEMLDKIVIHGKSRYDVYFRGIDANFPMAV